jgi:hypothetical protein
MSISFFKNKKQVYDLVEKRKLKPRSLQIGWQQKTTELHCISSKASESGGSSKEEAK